MIHKELAKLHEENQSIRIGVSGAGWIGSGFVTQVQHVKGMEVSVLADRDTSKAYQVFIDLGFTNEQIVETDSINNAEDSINKRKIIITQDYTLASKLESIDIIADVTPSPEVGAETAFSCIQYKKNIVMVNIEADVTVGHILNKKAQEAGVIYSVSSGDEPGCLAELYDWVITLGYEPIVIGKGKNNPLNPHATPETVKESAKRAGKDPFTIASYVDGTKTMFEMCCASNSTGCKPMQRGMIGPSAGLENISEIFALKVDGGITEFPGAVDFVQGPSMSGGVFITTRINDKRISNDLKYLKVGKGKYFTFFRPYHLWFLEAPYSVAYVYLNNEPWMAPLDQHISDVMTVAKKDLNPGEILDKFGGYTFHGVIDTLNNTRESNALPVGLAPGAKIKNAIKTGDIIKWNDVVLNEESIVVKLRREQDKLIT